MTRPLALRRPLVAVQRLLVARAVACCAAASGVAAVVGACGGRQVVVGTGGDAGATTTSVQFTNNLAQTVNVYLRGPDGGEVFLRQVPARTTEVVPVRGVRAGTAVQLRVAPVNGAANILRDNVVVGSGTAVQVP